LKINIAYASNVALAVIKCNDLTVRNGGWLCEKSNHPTVAFGGSHDYQNQFYRAAAMTINGTNLTD
jgi:hypothetical protein